MTRRFAPASLSPSRSCGGRGEAWRRFPDERAARRWFRGLLWRAFPAAQTDHDLARRAALTLEVSESRVRGWLRCDHDAKLSEVLRVLALAGASVVLPDDGGGP